MPGKNQNPKITKKIKVPALLTNSSALLSAPVTGPASALANLLPTTQPAAVDLGGPRFVG